MRATTRQETASRRRQFISSLLASSALVSAGSSYGQLATQTESENSDQSGEREIEEIVVRGVARRFRPDDQTSATGLRMSLVDTPQSITVLSSEVLDTIGAPTAYEAADLVPGMQRLGHGFGQRRMSLRGVPNSYRRVNGIQAGSGFGGQMVDSYLLERIEIVRGPATALYGVTGSFGGEINQILKSPEDENLFEVGIEVGDYDTQRYKFDVTGPISEEGAFRGRLTAKYSDFGQAYDIQNVDIRTEQLSAVGSLTWDISARTSASVWFYHEGRTGDPVDNGALVLTPEGMFARPQDAFPERVDADTWYFSHPDQSDEDFNDNLFIAEVVHSLKSDRNLRASLHWSESDYSSSIFATFGPFGAYGLADDQAYMYTYDVAQRDADELTFSLSLSDEIELFGREASFLVALEYAEVSPEAFKVLESVGVGFTDIDIYGAENFDGVQPLLADGTPFVPLDRSTLGVANHRHTDERNLRGSIQLLFKPLERLQVLAGLLVHDNRTEVTNFVDSKVVLSPPRVDESDFTETLGRLGVTYDLMENRDGIVEALKMYGSVTEGFEPQIVTSVTTGETKSLPREMTAYEVGAKAELLGGAAGFSIAYYDNTIRNIPSSSGTLGALGGFALTQGKQENRGVELELVGEMLPGWNAALVYTYYDGEISDDAIDEDTGLREFTFTLRPRSIPTNTGTLASTYEFLGGPLRGLQFGGLFTVADDYSFIDDLARAVRFGSPDMPATLIAGGFQRLDLMASYSFSGRFEGLRLYANAQNVLDEDIISASTSHPGFGVMFLDRKRMQAGFTFTFQ